MRSLTGVENCREEQFWQALAVRPLRAALLQLSCFRNQLTVVHCAVTDSLSDCITGQRILQHSAALTRLSVQCWLSLTWLFAVFDNHKLNCTALHRVSEKSQLMNLVVKWVWVISSRGGYARVCVSQWPLVCRNALCARAELTLMWSRAGVTLLRPASIVQLRRMVNYTVNLR